MNEDEREGKILTGQENIDRFLDENNYESVDHAVDKSNDDDEYLKYKPNFQLERANQKKSIRTRNTAVSSARESHLNYIHNYLHFYGEKKQIEEQLRKQHEDRLANFKTDQQMLAEQHQFIRDRDVEDNDDTEDSHGIKLAKQYESKLYREFCVANLSKYKQGLIGLRWRTENEVITGRGQDSCGSLTCKNKNKRASRNEIELHTLEVNFAYVELGEHKNALVKIRLCKKCTKKMSKANKIKSKKRKRESSSSDSEEDY